MKRFFTTLGLCFSLLLLLSYLFFRPVEAKEDVLVTLLNLPAPPPPNPLAIKRVGTRPTEFYDKSRPPGDDAPIEDLLEYWRFQAETNTALGYNPQPSDRVVQRLREEIEKDPKKLHQYVDALPDSSAEWIKNIYDRDASGSVFSQDERNAIKNWLTFHSPYYSSDLAKIARQAGDQGEYVSNQNELLALAKFDFDKAKPIIDALLAGGDKRATQVLAKWALYVHALETRSTSDIETYRKDLQAVVENKNANAGMRDLALDALVKEKEWTGRDDWYLSLLSDETLADLRVNGASYTGLTTIIYYSPDERFTQKMLELIKSENTAVRTAAIKNLVLIFNRKKDPEIVRALLPWLEDPKWANDVANSRSTLITALTQIEMPEAVPGLIKVLDEKVEAPRQVVFASNAIANAANTVANAMSAAANAMRAAENSNPSVLTYSNANRVANVGNYYPSNTMPYQPRGDGYFYPYRSEAVRALAKQKDSRAVPALRRLLTSSLGYDRNTLVTAILACRGFTVTEQLEAIDQAARGVRAEIDSEIAGMSSANSVAIQMQQTYESITNSISSKRPPTEKEIKAILAQQIIAETEITDELAQAMVERTEELDKKEPKLAAAYRRLALKWKNAAINSLFIRDLRRGAAESNSIVRLLAMRKELRVKQGHDLAQLSAGKPIGIGISACIFDEPADFKNIIEKGDPEAKIAMLACARLVRAKLTVASIKPMLKSENKMLSLAAERYLESENSVEAVNAVFARHPGEALILGATTAFLANGVESGYNEQLSELFQSVDNNETVYDGWIDDNAIELRKTETRLQTEIKRDANLVGIYAYDDNFIRVYKDKVLFTWEEEPSRYRERVLKKEEFDALKSYLAYNRVEEMAPFVSCGGEYCEAKELLMLGRDGGRRIFMNGETPRFFDGLDKYFKDVRSAPAAIKYALSKELAGLEILFANEEMHAETVWKNGDDLRVAASSREVRKKVVSEIEKAADGTGDGDEVITDAERTSRVDKLRDKLQFQGFAWFKLAAGKWSATNQPPQVPIIPVADVFSVPANQESWKAKTAEIEIRAGDDALYKISRGKMTKVRDGAYARPVVSANGKWVVAARTGEENAGLVRINLLTGKEFSVASEEMSNLRAKAYVPLLGRFLIVAEYEGDMHAEYYESSADEDDQVKPDPEPESTFLLDAETGKLEPAPAELRPLTQQTYRPLQKASRLNDYWAALPDSEKNETRVGLWDSRTLAFRQVLRIPEITFNSMSLWADEPGNKLYFVYRGHMLSLPLKQVK